jgi:deoxyribodipyrimidine photo-lyase
VAVQAANALGKPVVVFFAPRPFPAANLRHYAFLAQGIRDVAEAVEKRRIGFVLRRFPEHSLLKFCEEVGPHGSRVTKIPFGRPRAGEKQWRRS